MIYTFINSFITLFVIQFVYSSTVYLLLRSGRESSRAAAAATSERPGVGRMAVIPAKDSGEPGREGEAGRGEGMERMG